MTLEEYRALPADQRGGRPAKQKVACNSLAKTKVSFNCNLTPDQAIDLARLLLEKAHEIRHNKIDDAAVQLWNVGEGAETLYLG